MAPKKRFWIPAERIRRVVDDDRGCIASDSIMVDGCTVGFFYRGSPSCSSDSGWVFFSGEESTAEKNDPNMLGVYSVNEVCNYDPSIIPFLDSPVGTAFRYDGSLGQFVAVELGPT